MEPVIGLPHIHRHPHRGPSTRQQLVRQPIHLPERITERVESQHTHCNLQNMMMRTLDIGFFTQLNRYHMA